MEKNAPGKLLSTEGVTTNLYLFLNRQYVNVLGYYYLPDQDTGLNMALLDYDKKEESFRHVRCVKDNGLDKSPSCDKNNIKI